MTANNQGIDHITRAKAGVPSFGFGTLCGNRRAHMARPIDSFRADDGQGRWCARCVAKLAQMDAAKARRAGAR